MDAQTHPQTAWFELKGSAIDYKIDDHALRFLLLQRGTDRTGALLLNGRPLLLVPVGEA